MRYAHGVCAKSTHLTVERVFGRRVREARERRGISQAELAEHLRFDRTVVSKIEKGQRKVGIGEALAFAAALEVAPISLLTPRDDEEDVGITSELVLPAVLVRAWIRGQVGLPGGDPISHLAELPVSEQREFFRGPFRQELPPNLRISPLVRALGGGQAVPSDEVVDQAIDALAVELEKRLEQRRLRREENNDG